MDEESARVGVSDLAWIERSQVVSVRRVRTLLGSGVRFETADGRYDGVIFWSFDSRSVLAGFNQLGWPTA